MKHTLQKTTLSLVLFAGMIGAAWSPASQACSPDPYLTDICVMAVPNYANGFNEYMPAAGQTLRVSDYSAVYALIGTTYGGDGITTFNLPDMRGRVVVGAGQGPGLPNYRAGQTGGAVGIQMTAAMLPEHKHTLGSAATVTTATGTLAATTTLSGLSATVSGSLALKASSATSTQGNPSGNYLGTTALSTNRIYSDSAPTLVSMNAGSIDSSGLSVGNFTGNPTTTLTGGPSVTLGGSTDLAGAAQPSAVPVMQPYLSMYYFIAVRGIFPQRN